MVLAPAPAAIIINSSASLTTCCVHLHSDRVWMACDRVVGVVVLRIDVTGPDSIQSTLIAVYDPRAPLPMSIVNFAIKRVAVSQRGPVKHHPHPP